MGDVFNEQLVKRESSKKTTAIKTGIIVGSAIISFLLSLLLGALGMMVAVFLVMLATTLINNQNLEYEYSVTNGEFDVDTIFNKTKRKKAISISIKDIEVMASVSNKEHEAEFANAETVKDYSSGTEKDNTYQFIIHLEGKRTKVIIEPNDSMLKAMKAYLSPRKFFK